MRMMDEKIPDKILEILRGKKIQRVAIKVKYKNWKGEIGMRNIIPMNIFHGSTEFHKEEQWLLKVWDLDKKDYRTYALKDIQEWKH